MTTEPPQIIILPTGTAIPPTPAAAVERQPLWTFQTQGAVWSSPLVADGTAYFGSDDQFFYAVDATSGQLRWKFPTGGLVRSRPVKDQGNLFFASDDGYLYALESATGQEKWKLDIGYAAAKRLPPADDYNWDYLQSSPTIADGALYVGSADGQLYAVNPVSGAIIWRFKTGDRIRSSPAMANGTVYVGSWDGFIYAMDAKTGKEQWKFDAHGAWTPVQPSPLVVDGTVFIGSRDFRFLALDAHSGQAKWTYYYVQGWVESSATLADGIVYVGSSEDRTLYAIHSDTGRKAWSFKNDGVVFTSPAVADGAVYFGSAHWTDGLGTHFYAVDIQQGLARKTLDVKQARWYVEIGATLDQSPLPVHGVVSSPTVENDIVYFGGLDGKLYAVSTLPYITMIYK